MPDRDLSSKTCYMIAQSHLDPAFMWRWPEGRAEAIATCRAAVDRLSEYQELVFCHSDAVVYQWIQREDPELFDAIRRLVKQGRWNIVGGWWVQADCILPTGECLIRQGLIGKRMLREWFGCDVRVGYLVDSFGHPCTLPRILQASGYDYFVFARPPADRFSAGSPLFWWEADDANRVLAYQLPAGSGYSTSFTEHGKHLRELVQDLPGWMEQVMCFFGVGNHGGGPTKAQIDNVRELQHRPGMPKICFSDPETYLRSVQNQPNIPVYRGEIGRWAIGCYSAASGLKRANRQAQVQILQAERWASLAQVAGTMDFPAEKFPELWKDLLFNQFHDILPGSAIKPALEDALNLYGKILSDSDTIMVDATRSLVSKIDTGSEPGVFVIFNSLPWQRQGYVRHEPWTMWEPWGRRRILDETGQEVPIQEIDAEAASSGIVGLLMRVTVPACGYRVFRMDPGHLEVPEADSLQLVPPLPRKPLPMVDVLENSIYRITFDGAGGTIRSLYHKGHNLELTDGLLNRAVVLRDESDTWSLRADRYDDLIGEFQWATIEELERGPLRWSVKVTRHYEKSALVQEIRIFDQSDLIEFVNELQWYEQHKLLKLCFPFTLREAVPTYEVPFGHTVHEPGSGEHFAHDWVDLTGWVTDARGQEMVHGIALLNDSKYGFDTIGNELRMTVVRSPVYCHEQLHFKYQPGPRHQFMDQGLQEFRFALLPHRGGWHQSQIPRRAAEFVCPTSTALTTAHRGDLPPRHSFVSVDAHNVSVAAIKPAEDRQGYVLRLVETSSRETTTCINWFGQNISIQLGPLEIATLVLSRSDRGWEIKRTNALEKLQSSRRSVSTST